ncbi:hypothetical protein DC20_20775 [Rufibacter tibetensis]|uniref:Glycosyltransferase n=2 Tax=Rufibacter tibetensis TaxID=512763 RepID=A0A0P0CZQ4_9BACT|nr:hypothetical protein DC20_20775 [Rufibacter tibetensis]
MGGAQVLAVDLINGMCGAHEMHLVVVNNIHSSALLRKLNKRVVVHLINRKEGSRNPWPLVKFNLLLRQISPDVIHLHEPNIGKIIKAGVGKKIYTIHDVGIPTTDYHHYDALVAISDAVHKDVAHRINRPIITVYNGIDASAFRKRSGYKLEGEKIKLVQLSRLMHEKKGQDVLLQALEIIKDQYGFSNFTLDLVGIGPSLDYLEELTSKLGLTEEVVFSGERDRDWLYLHLANYHLLVQPSRYEGFGLTILEGFAAGLPVLASDIEGPAEIISRTSRGFLFRNGDIQDCAKKLIQLLSDYETGKIEQLMNATVPVTEQEYSVAHCIEGYLNLYKNLISNKIT